VPPKAEPVLGETEVIVGVAFADEIGKRTDRQVIKKNNRFVLVFLI
jgi:hypothetical protein